MRYKYKDYTLELRPGGRTTVYDVVPGYVWDLTHTVRVYLSDHKTFITPDDSVLEFLLEQGVIKFDEATQSVSTLHIFYNFSPTEIGV